MQNKVYWAVHSHTAAELIAERANAEKDHMSLTTWEATPEGKIVKAAVSIAKNYLRDKEMSHMGRIVAGSDRPLPEPVARKVTRSRRGCTAYCLLSQIVPCKTYVE